MGSIPCSSQITCGRGEGEAGSAVTRGKRKRRSSRYRDDYYSPGIRERVRRARAYVPPRTWHRSGYRTGRLECARSERWGRRRGSGQRVSRRRRREDGLMRQFRKSTGRKREAESAGIAAARGRAATARVANGTWCLREIRTSRMLKVSKSLGRVP